MVEVHSRHPLLPLPFSHTQSSEAKLTWMPTYDEQLHQDWERYSWQIHRTPSEEYCPSRSGQEEPLGPCLPYPSPKSLPRTREATMAVNAVMSQQQPRATTGALVDHKVHGPLSSSIQSEIAQARQFFAGQANVNSRMSSKPASPVFQQAPQSFVGGGHSIVSYLQLPATITTKEGSLSEFAAQLTCLFWFESSNTVTKIENAELSPSSSTRFIPEAYPATGFMKWVTTILSTTQVTQNVILLALLFIYRLKRQCPNVKGKLGSEYRLLTVALMLGNKFLDDNTYTNKTWAEVSGISVHEIHVMEVEFLSHMKYDLYTSKEHWDRWHLQLSKFWKCFEQKQKEDYQRQTDALRPSIHIPQPLPSPPASTHASPPYGPPISPGTGAFPNATTFPLYPSTSDYASQPNSRKRSRDDDLVEPPSKRPSMQAHPGTSAVLSNIPGYPQLPALPLPVSSSFDPQQGYIAGRGSMAFQPSLPVGGRTSPAGAYPQSANWLAGIPAPTLPQPHHMPSHAHPQPSMPINQTLRPRHPSSLSVATRTHSMSNSAASTPSIVYPPPLGFAYPSQMSIPSINSTAYSANASVPLSAYSQTIIATSASEAYRQPAASQRTPSAPTPSSSTTHALQPNQLSPSHFLTSRSSPYRPVRNMSQLLVPPPTTSIPQHPGDISQDQMRWQPLGKNNEERHAGRVPYLHREAWPQTHQVDQWPTM